MTDNTPALTLAAEIAERYASLPQVQAVTLGGSYATGQATANSDIDLYVYANATLALSVRAAIAGDTTAAEIGNAFWEPGDEWQDAATGIHVDVMIREPRWIEKDLDRLFNKSVAHVGYTTCLWHNVRTSRILFDRAGWYAALQERANLPYPDRLREAIVAQNHTILRKTLSSYAYQIGRAVECADAVSVNHRVAAVLASYFDILFAVNRQTHPGEKRLVQQAEAVCPHRPANMAADVNALVSAAGSADPGVLDHLHALVDGLDALLREEGLLPA